MDFKKVIGTAMIPTVALVVLGIIGVVLGFVLRSGGTIVGLISLAITIGIFGISCLILLYGGYSATKRSKLDLVGALLVGATAGFVSSIINGIINLIMMIVNLSSVASQMPSQNVSSETIWAAGGIIGILGLVIGIVLWLFIGAVLGVIGGFIGQKI